MELRLFTVVEDIVEITHQEAKTSNRLKPKISYQNCHCAALI
jgi:hypothetical protein